MNEINVKVKLEIDSSELYTLCYRALDHADSGSYEVGSNYWVTMFSDKLKEELDNHIRIIKVENT